MAHAGRLVDHGLEVVWVDPYFDVGRMGMFYYNVPANTNNENFMEGLRMVKSLEYDLYLERPNHSRPQFPELPSLECAKLGVFIDTLRGVLPTLQQKVTPIKGFVSELITLRDRRGWKVTIDLVSSDAFNSSSSQRRDSYRPQFSC